MKGSLSHPVRTLDERGAYLLCPKVPAPRDFNGLLGPHNPHDGGQAEDEAEGGDGGEPDIEKTRGEVIAKVAQGAPALVVTA